MTDAAREQQATAAVDKLKDIFNRSSKAQKLILKAFAGLAAVLESDLNRRIKYDAMFAAIVMVATGSGAYALEDLHDCHEDTQAPLEAVHAVMALQAIDEFEKHHNRFNTMMQLFSDEADKRARDGLMKATGD